ncbi:hypothetical protein MLW01_24985, partial [Escherichia coli]|nr:hypothetical protein [Escherichia coli]
MTLAATADDSCPSHRGKLTVLFLSVASDDTQIPKVSRIEESVLFIYRTPSWIALDWPPESPDNQYHLN